MKTKIKCVRQDDLRKIIGWALSRGITDPEMQASLVRLAVKAFEFSGAKYIDWGGNKITVIKAHRAATGAGLKESKIWVESGPHNVSSQKLAKALAAAGATLDTSG